MQRLSIFLLGPPLVEIAGLPVRPGTRKTLALLAFLAISRRQHRRESLINLLWPDYAKSSGQASLRNSLHPLREAIGGSRLDASRDSVGLKPGGDTWIDVERFRGLIAQCGAHGHRMDQVCAACRKPLGAAAELYRGDFLSGFGLPDSANFDDWQPAQTEALRSDMELCFDRLTLCLREQGDPGRAIRYACTWLERDRMNETAHRRLMDLYVMSGQRTAALRQYEACAQILQEELGAEPESETKQLFEHIRDDDITVTKPAFRRPDGAFSNNLPHQPTRFFGRGKQMQAIRKLLPETHILTLTGAGGCGKTRLALETASTLLEEHEDGVWLVELAPLSDPALIPHAVAAALDVTEQAGTPVMETLVSYLRRKQLLLVMDNCEHLIDECARVVAGLSGSCRSLSVIATSREPLNVPGEVIWRVPSLEFPPENCLDDLKIPELSAFAAVELFMDRAASAMPAYTLTDPNAAAAAQICRRLDGIPLAIELAAARLRALTVEQILAGLDDRFRLLSEGSRTAPARHRTLRAAIDWSYDLLSPKEKTLFRRFSVFAGGFTLAAAESICADEGADGLIASGDILNLTAHLVDKSMVQREEQEGHARYRLLESVRQFALEQLVESGEAENAKARHADYYLKPAQEVEFFGQEHVAWLRKLDAEHNNVRAALAWSLDGEQVELGQRSTEALWWFWYVRGHMSEGQRWLGEALSKGSDVPAALRAGLLCRAGHLAIDLGEVARAKALLLESMVMSEQIGDNAAIAQTLYFRGLLSYMRGDFQNAAVLYEKSMALSEQVGPKWFYLSALEMRGRMALEQGDLELAEPHLTEALVLSRNLRADYHIAVALRDLGQLELVRAAKHGVARCLGGLATVAAAKGRLEKAVRLFAALWAEGRSMPLEQAIGYALEKT